MLVPLVEATTRDVCVVVAVVGVVWGTAKAVVAAAEVELVNPNAGAEEVAGVLLAADEPTPKEGKVVVEAAAEEDGALVAAGVEEDVVVVVVAIENSAGDVVDAGAELAGVANENEEDDEVVCEGAEGEIAGVELPVLFEKESPVEAENGEAKGLVIVEEVLLVENPNWDGEEAAAAPDKEDDPKMA